MAERTDDLLDLLPVHRDRGDKLIAMRRGVRVGVDGVRRAGVAATVQGGRVRPLVDRADPVATASGQRDD